MRTMARDLFPELLPPLADDEALLEAELCLECGGANAPAPCAAACPAEIDVPGFIGAIARGDDEAAARLIYAENLLGASCALVCPVETLCEGACVLLHEGRRPVAIGQLQRHAAERALSNGFELPRPHRATGRRVAVIGAGPAGLACAGELALLGHEVTVFDSREEVGGLVRFGIAPYKLWRDPLPAEATKLAELGVRFELRHPIATEDDLRELEARHDACVLCAGMGEDLDVHYPGDELPGVWESLPFVEAIKTEMAPEVGDHVLVIGGGNTAIDVARESVRLGAKNVTILYRRTEAEMPAYPLEVEEAREEGIRFEWLTNPTRIVGHDFVIGVECVDIRLGIQDTSGRPRPEPVPGSEHTYRADTVIKALGQRPRSELLEWIGVDAPKGLVAVDAKGRTSKPRWFAAGDATNGGATVVEAVAEAKRAALGVHELLGRTR
jgi:dihydropyrimidine dehydrogenase (NAD+) subunit PreT